MITKYSIEKLQSEFQRLGYQWLPFMIIGVRSTANINNKFDDLIGVVENNAITWFSGTTNAGRHWLLNFLNPKGTAMLKAGQYINCWELGYHKGQYLALVQTGGKVTVYRDANKNEIAEEQGNTRKIFSDSAIKLLQEYDWTGNIRELRNVVERLIILGGQEISESDVKLFASK
jgi:hypothetical protein